MIEAIEAKNNCLSGFKKKFGEEETLAPLVLMIDATVKYFSVGKTMNSFQLGETARLILQEFYYLKFEDLRVFFERLKTGFYGETYDRIDGNVIMVNLRKYCEERFELCGQIQIQKHKQIEKDNEDYIIQVCSNYVRASGDVFEEVELKELATAFTFGVAIKLKEWIVKDYYPTTPNEVKIQDKRKAEQSFFDYLEHNKPELLPKGERFKRATNEYYEMKEKILKDESLDTFQKENAIRTLAGLEPLTIEEFNQQQIIYAKHL